ncbi:hypothetical protein GCM10009104_32740 [Marinobacterium maritimum]|uniref:Cyclic nucleotide-binding domain-containing protein n=1 Tax=Marinobacterium maritimum TaxID=500162 RepID=A0ABP3TGL6_9GAMM
MQELSGETLLQELGMDFLKSASTFGALSEPAIRQLMIQGRVFRLSDGDFLFKPGERGDSFFVILQGSVSYYRQNDGQPEHICDYHVGQEIGFVSLIALTSRLGTAVASSDALVLEVDSDHFYALHCAYPLDFGVLMMNLSRELARSLIKIGATLAEYRHAAAKIPH